ncbi:Hypothetical predicted protein, partial [Paramuricea clavata]
MSEEGFNLRKWNSNSSTLLESINKGETHQDPLTKFERKVIAEDESHTKSTIGPNNSNREKSVKEKRREERSSSSQVNAFAATEINQAESMWLRTVQMSSFESELDFIENSRDCCPPAHVILRCKG